MAKEVILMEDVDGLGLTGDIVKVSDGYARNYLIPQGKAEPVTEAARRRVEKRRAAAEAQRAARRAEAEALAQKIGSAHLEIRVRVGADGRMFGSVTAHDLSAELQKRGIAVERHKIQLPHPLKELGDHRVPVRLMADVHAELSVTLLPE